MCYLKHFQNCNFRDFQDAKNVENIRKNRHSEVF
nr:MAG TPA: hypothetical protein [Caudoviricetes sp.]